MADNLPFPESPKAPNHPARVIPTESVPIPRIADSAAPNNSRPGKITRILATLGFSLYAIFAPHSIAGAEISLGFVGIALVIAIATSVPLNLYRTRVDFPILLFLIWTVCSSFLSPEPHIALAKLQSVCVVFLLYLVRSLVTRRIATLLVALMISSAVAGTAWSAIELVRGRGVVIDELAPDSPFRRTDVQPGDAIWRLQGHRVDSVDEIDNVVRSSPPESLLGVGIIRDGENAEFSGIVPTSEERQRTSPSGLVGSRRTHRFRASGWTRHYETFSETLQVLAQLSLGLALAWLIRDRRSLLGRAALVAAIVLTAGIAMTAMRTVLVALVIGAAFTIWKAGSRRIKLIGTCALVLVIAVAVFSVWRTRSQGSVVFRDDSSALRYEVAIAGLHRITLHPIFGIGMDAVHRHWHEWGFPGDVVIHLHSTPLELAFERGLPALAFWIWLMLAWWRITWRSEKAWKLTNDPQYHGILLGSLGAIIGFTASSLVNYNFGDGEVALVFWFLMGIVIVVAPREIAESKHRAPIDPSSTFSGQAT